jgi:hypothetical protein
LVSSETFFSSFAIEIRQFFVSHLYGRCKQGY